jgi:hypothetical protein
MPRAIRLETTMRRDGGQVEKTRPGTLRHGPRLGVCVVLLACGGFVLEAGAWGQSTLTIVDSFVTGGPGPAKARVSALGRSIHVLGLFDAQTIELRSDVGSLLATIPVDGKPTDVACLDDGTLGITFEGGQLRGYRIILVDGSPTLDEVARSQTDGTVTTSVDVDAGSDIAVVTNFEPGNIQSFRLGDGDLDGNGEIDALDMAIAGTKPNVVAIAEGILDSGSARTEPGRLAAPAVAAQSLVAIANDGSNDLSLFALDKNGNFTTLDQSFPVGGRPRTLRFSPDGRFLFVATALRTAQQPALQDEIQAYQVASSGALSLVGRTFGGRFLTDLDVTPDGLVAVTVNDNVKDEVRTYRRQGSELTLDASIETPGVSGLPPSFKKVSVGRDCGSEQSNLLVVNEYQANRTRLLRWTPTGASPTPCVTLAENRFEVRVDWSVPSENRSGVATGTPITTDTGHFWFFDAANVELVVKVLDARVINGHFWVFYGALTDVEYTITVTDTQTGAVRTYFNPAGTQASGADTSAFEDSGGASAEAARRLVDSSRTPVSLPASAACSPTDATVCLAQGRFEVSVDWSTPTASGTGTAVALSSDTGYFWFFDDANVELIVKVLDARVINGKFWVYYGALSDVEYTITVTDTQTGAQKTYFNPSGTLGSGSDTSAF